MPVYRLPTSSGFQLLGGEYAVPLVYRVSSRGKLEMLGTFVAEAGLAATALISGTTKAAAVRAVPRRVTTFLLLMTMLYVLLVSCTGPKGPRHLALPGQRALSLQSG